MEFVVVSERDENRAREFVREHWPKLVTAAGVLTVAGAAVWLTARYLMEKKRKKEDADQLKIAEEMAILGQQGAPVLIESADLLVQTVGRLEAGDAAEALRSAVGEGGVGESLMTLSALSRGKKVGKMIRE